MIPKEKKAIFERLQWLKSEIKRYPTPIAGCDEQFEFLLSERDRLTRELSEFRSSREQSRDLKGLIGNKHSG